MSRAREEWEAEIQESELGLERSERVSAEQQVEDLREIVYLLKESIYDMMKSTGGNLIVQDFGRLNGATLRAAKALKGTKWDE